MKIHFIFNFESGPTGGGNQFLKNLKKFLIQTGKYTDNSDEADLYLFNSYQFINETIEMKKKYPKKIFIHRIDGPIRLYNSMSDRRDKITNTANQYLADATIFQSKWSRKTNYKLGLKKNNYESLITNTADPKVFYPAESNILPKKGKIGIIITSWSNNWKKGYKTYQWIDKHLDFSRYQVTFVGNSPVKFNNIMSKAPKPSNELADEIRKNQIFLTASQKDPCSNSLVEAMQCGLPALALNDGGHPELVGKAGLLFDDQDEIPAKLEMIVDNYEKYAKKAVMRPTIQSIGEDYENFFTQMLEEQRRGYTPKKVSPYQALKIKTQINLWRFDNIKSGFLK